MNRLINGTVDEFFTFDCESLGFYGEIFQVAGGVYRIKDCLPISEFCFGVKIKNMNNTVKMSDLDWVLANCDMSIETHQDTRSMRDDFWKIFIKARNDGIPFVADCGFPIEARFLGACIMDEYEERYNSGPYPLHELATLLSVCGLDPTGTFERQENELPAHHPLMDARQSARLTSICIKKLREKEKQRY